MVYRNKLTAVNIIKNQNVKVVIKVQNSSRLFKKIFNSNVMWGNSYLLMNHNLELQVLQV